VTRMEKILSGKPAMLHYVEQVKARVSALGEKGVTPGLCVVWVGEDPSAEATAPASAAVGRWWGWI